MVLGRPFFYRFPGSNGAATAAAEAPGRGLRARALLAQPALRSGRSSAVRSIPPGGETVLELVPVLGVEDGKKASKRHFGRFGEVLGLFFVFFGRNRTKKNNITILWVGSLKNDTPIWVPERTPHPFRLRVLLKWA